MMFEAINWANNLLTQFHGFSTMSEIFDNDSQSKGRSTKKNKEIWPNSITRGCMIPKTVL